MMMRTRSPLLPSLLGSLTLLATACGDDGGAPADAPKDIGFNKPDKSLKANMENADKTWTEIGPADLSCLNTPSNDQATTVAVDLTTTIRDFQKEPPNNLVPNATVTVFPEQRADMPFGGMTYTSNPDTAMLTVQIPVGTKRFGFKVSATTALDTLLLNQTVDPAMMAQTLEEVRTVSKQTAQTLPALIGVSRTAGTGILAGAMRDCAHHEISNFVATVSTESKLPTHLDGADAYYFSESKHPLPGRHSQYTAANTNGLFVIIQMAPTPSAFVQIWGYPTDGEIGGDMTLIAELPTAIVADTVITGSYEPLRQ